MAAKGLKVIGVPKTIDNDLMGTFTTFGFDTAVAQGGLASVPLSEVGGKVRVIPLEDSLLQAARKLGIYFGDGD